MRTSHISNPVPSHCRWTLRRVRITSQILSLLVVVESWDSKKEWKKTYHKMHTSHVSNPVPSHCRWTLRHVRVTSQILSLLFVVEPWDSKKEWKKKTYHKMRTSHISNPVPSHCRWTLRRVHVTSQILSLLVVVEPWDMYASHLESCPRSLFESHPFSSSLWLVVTVDKYALVSGNGVLVPGGNGWRWLADEWKFENSKSKQTCDLMWPKLDHM